MIAVRLVQIFSVLQIISTFRPVIALQFSHQQYLKSRLLPQNSYVTEGDIMIGIILPSSQRGRGRTLCSLQNDISSLDTIYAYKYVLLCIVMVSSKCSSQLTNVHLIKSITYVEAYFVPAMGCE